MYSKKYILYLSIVDSNIGLISDVEHRDSIIHIYRIYIHTHRHTHSFHMVYQRILNIVPCAIQQDPVVLSILHKIVCIC